MSERTIPCIPSPFALCSIPFDPAPRDESFSAKTRIPDYFL
jgi:hypothetical protein